MYYKWHGSNLTLVFLMMKWGTCFVMEHTGDETNDEKLTGNMKNNGSKTLCLLESSW